MEKEKKVININAKNIGSTESFKKLRTSIMYTDQLKVISVTSSLPDEGKTVASFNLANSFAMMGKRVCLIDCDLRKSSLRSYLAISEHLKGVSECLTRQTNNIVYKTNIDNLYIVMAGKKPPNPSELLSSDRMGEMIKQLKAQFDYVIFDTPPISAAMDSIIVGRQCDGVLFVVRSDFAKRQVVLRSKVDMERNGCRIIGVVLNGVKKSSADYGGYYDYYYGSYY